MHAGQPPCCPSPLSTKPKSAALSAGCWAWQCCWMGQASRFVATVRFRLNPAPVRTFAHAELDHAVSGRVLRALLLGRRRSEATLRRGDALAGELRPLGGLGQAPALEVEAHLHQQPRVRAAAWRQSGGGRR